MSGRNNRGRARIISQTTVARNYREMKLEYINGDAPESLPRPGSFFTLLPLAYPLQGMRRPFAYSDADDKGFSFIYEIRGEATADLAAAEPGTLLDWIGPLGSTFPVPQTGRTPVLVAGGIGLGPILYMARRLAGEMAAGTPETIVVLGARNAGLVPDIKWPGSINLRITTDDGSAGLKGNALVALEELEQHGRLENVEYYTCGPHPMMAGIHRLATESGAACWASMEEMMACGVGACQGCAVELADKGPDGGPTYKRACVEGPIFNSRELAW